MCASLHVTLAASTFHKKSNLSVVAFGRMLVLCKNCYG